MNLPNPREAGNLYDTIQTKSHRGSDATSEGKPSRRNSILDVDGVEKEGKSSIESNGIDRKCHE